MRGVFWKIRSLGLIGYHQLKKLRAFGSWSSRFALARAAGGGTGMWCLHFNMHLWTLSRIGASVLVQLSSGKSSNELLRRVRLWRVGVAEMVASMKFVVSKIWGGNWSLLGNIGFGVFP